MGGRLDLIFVVDMQLCTTTTTIHWYCQTTSWSWTLYECKTLLEQTNLPDRLTLTCDKDYFFYPMDSQTLTDLNAYIEKQSYPYKFSDAL